MKKSIAIFLAFVMLLTSFFPVVQTPFSPRQVEAAGDSCSAGGLASNLQAKVGGVALDQAATFLANMDDITGAYYDSTLDRIVFVGKKNTTLPEFDKDDLAVAIKAFVFNRTIPAVSIEPPDASDPNMMRIFYYGGIENTKFGKVLFDSDYVLKHYISGFDANNNRITSAVPGYKNMTERFIDKNPTPGPIANQTRWWIVPKLMSLNRDDTTDSFVFDQTIMEVKSEQMSANNDPKWNEAANEFAQHHTQYYDQFSQERPIYTEAKQLGKIVSIVKWLVDRNIATDFNWARDYAPKIVTTPQKIPQEAVQGTYNGWTYTFFGGIAYTTPNAYNTDATQASSLKNASQAVPTTKEDIHWTFTKDGQQYESVAVAADAFRTLGSYNTSITDMSFPTAGDLTLAFQRSYSSYSGGQHGVGRGWNIYPAKLVDNKSGWYVACTSGQTGNHPWKLALQTPGGLFETFTYYNCTTGYVTDDSSYHSQMFHNTDGTFTARLKDQTEFNFDTSYKLTQIKDKNGNTIAYNYDGSGKLINITDSKGHQLALNYTTVNGQDLIASVQDWSGRKAEYTYDNQGNLLTVKDPKGNITTYAYDSNFKLTSITDREGKTVVINIYTPEAKLATQKDAANITQTYSHDDTNRIVTINDNLGRIHKTKYDSKARVLEKTDPLLKNLTYTYGTELAPLTAKDKNGNTTTFTYDNNGNVTSIKYPNNKIVSYQYDAKNRLTQVTDNRYGSSAKLTTYTYDTNGNPTNILEDSSNEKKYTYDPAGEILTYADELSNQTKWTRDNFGNKLTETHFYDDRTTSFTYDSLGRLVKQTDAEGKEVNYTYDANTNLLTQADGSGTTTNLYDKENHLIKATLPNNSSTNFAYNPSGSLTSVTDAINSVTGYGYDAYQNLTSKQDALSRQTQYLYDQLNRRTQTTTPLGNVAKWEYDANGNLTKRIDEDNNSITYQYNNLNRLTQITYPDLKTITFSYDDRNNLTQMIDPSGTTTYAYDRFDRLTQVQNTNGTLSYQYDSAGKLTKITYPDGKTVSYNYDSDNTLTKIIDWNNLETKYGYYKNSLPQLKTFPNGIKGTYLYDAANRLSGLEYKKDSQTLAKFTYERDNVGNITKAIEEGSFLLPPPSPSSSYIGEYFTNQTLSGTPTLTRSDNQINFDWGQGSPDTSIPADHFSTRWTKTETFSAGIYEFTANGDDGIRLFVDGEKILDKWIDQSPTTYTVTKTLSAGNHTIVYEYYESGGGAVAKLSYQPATSTPTPTPTPSANVYSGQYFTNKTLSGTPTLTRDDTSINFDWGNGSPDPSIPADHFSTRWTKTTNFAAGNYQFSTTSDDGVRLYIDNELVIDKWIDQGPTTYTVIKALSAGNHTIKMEYFENGGGAVAKLNYQQTDQPPADTYSGEYYDNTTLSGAPKLTRNDSVINFDWNNTSPDPIIPADRFSARWTKTQNFSAGTYQFSTTTDDGVKFFIDNELLIDKWIDQGPTTYIVSKNLASGNHTIKMEYYENVGGAVAKLNYQQTASTGIFNTFLAKLGLNNLHQLLSFPTAHAQTPPTQYVTTYTYDALGRLLKGAYPSSNLYEYTYDGVGNRTTSKNNSILSNYTYNVDNQLTTKDTTSYTHDKRGNQTATGSNTFSYNFENKLTQFINGGTTTQYTYDVLNKLDEVMRELEIIREDRELREDVDDHEKRLRKLEPSTN